MSESANGVDDTSTFGTGDAAASDRSADTRIDAATSVEVCGGASISSRGRLRCAPKNCNTSSTLQYSLWMPRFSFSNSPNCSCVGLDVQSRSVSVNQWLASLSNRSINDGF